MKTRLARIGFDFPLKSNFVAVKPKLLQFNIFCSASVMPVMVMAVPFIMFIEA